MDSISRYHESRRITLLGAGKNAVLAFFKIVFGWLGHSHALFADGIHSLSDLLIDALVLIASRFGSKAADHEHPYGHARIETAAVVALAMLLMLAGVGIIWDAVQEVLGARVPMKPSFYVFLIALLSMIINEVLYHYTHRVGRRVRSNLLMANAWHHRSDSATSIVVLIGVAVAWFGFTKFDALAALIVGVMIIYMAWRFGWRGARELVDTGIEDELLEKIKDTIVNVPGVCALHQLRTRLMGGRIFLDVHLLVDPTISVSEGHYIGQQVHFRLLKEIPDVADVTAHIDPEDDEIVAPSRHLPHRKKLMKILYECWNNKKVGTVNIVDHLDKMVVHYLAGKVYIELHLPISCVQLNKCDPEVLQKQLQQAARVVPKIASIKVFFN